MQEKEELYEISKDVEFQRLAHLLNTEEEHLSYLKKLSNKDLFDLRIRISDSIQNEHAGTWAKLASVSKFMPNFINAKVSEDILGPSISANLTYHIPVKEAIAISASFSIQFMVDVIEHLNPSKLETLLAEYPVERIKRIVTELEKRNAYYTMGNFVDYIPQHKVILIANQIQSEETLIRSGSYANKKHRLAPVIKEFTDARLKKLLVKGDEIKLHSEIIEIIKFIPDNELVRYISILLSIGGDVFKNYLDEVKKTEGNTIEKIKKSLQSLGVKIDVI